MLKIRVLATYMLEKLYQSSSLPFPCFFLHAAPNYMPTNRQPWTCDSLHLCHLITETFGYLLQPATTLFKYKGIPTFTALGLKINRVNFHVIFCIESLLQVFVNFFLLYKHLSIKYLLWSGIILLLPAIASLFLLMKSIRCNETHVYDCPCSRSAFSSASDKMKLLYLDTAFGLCCTVSLV